MRSDCHRYARPEPRIPTLPITATTPGSPNQHSDPTRPSHPPPTATTAHSPPTPANHQAEQKATGPTPPGNDATSPTTGHHDPTTPSAPQQPPQNDDPHQPCRPTTATTPPRHRRDCHALFLTPARQQPSRRSSTHPVSATPPTRTPRPPTTNTRTLSLVHRMRNFRVINDPSNHRIISTMLPAGRTGLSNRTRPIRQRQMRHIHTQRRSPAHATTNIDGGTTPCPNSHATRRAVVKRPSTRNCGTPAASHDPIHTKCPSRNSTFASKRSRTVTTPEN